MPEGDARGLPWLILRGAEQEAVLWNGPVLELHTRGAAEPARPGHPRRAAGSRTGWSPAAARASTPAREVGDALLDQRLVAGIGNLWKAESLWDARDLAVAAARGGETTDDGLLRRRSRPRAGLMRAVRSRARVGRNNVYRRAGRRLSAAAARRSARGARATNARIAYWCPGCQA